MQDDAPAVLGTARAAADGRFPILCKILDARETLSVQVHPPEGKAGQLGEPKTEMWYITAAEPDAVLHVGLSRGVTRERFEAGIRDGRVSECLQRLPVRAGDSMFLPSGRVHAIGGGLVIFEIQQNSDTTYRVFDWNRPDLDGRPRQLHLTESLASIDFSDIEPRLTARDASSSGSFTVRPLVRDSKFDVDLVSAVTPGIFLLQPPRLRIVASVQGQMSVRDGARGQTLAPGQFCLLPAALNDTSIEAAQASAFLVVEPGS
jgi:mannose-6-phosphate isomerase